MSAPSFDTYRGEDMWETAHWESYVFDDRGNIKSVMQTVDLGEGLTALIGQDFLWRTTGSSAGDEDIPAAFAFEPAYPNPFNPSTRLEYRIGASGRVALPFRRSPTGLVLKPLGFHSASPVPSFC